MKAKAKFWRGLARILSSVGAGLIYCAILLLGAPSRLEAALAISLTLALVLLLKSRIPIRLLLATSLFMLLPVAAMTAATIEYASGSPAFHSGGPPGSAAQDPEYRIPSKSKGCLVFGLEGLTRTPHNRTLALLIKTFGFPASSYQGELPTRKAAVELLRREGQTVLREHGVFLFIEEFAHRLKRTYEVLYLDFDLPVHYISLSDDLVLIGQEATDRHQLFIYDLKTDTVKFAYPDLFKNRD